MLSRWRSLWIVVIVMILACGGGYYYYSRMYVPARAAQEPALQTARVRRGEIVISASGGGTVVPRAEIELGFYSGGVLAEVLVQVGDEVLEGDVLARLDDSDARQALRTAELQVAKAEVNLATTEVNLAKVETGPTPEELASARAALASAEENLAEVKAGPTAGQIAAAEASLKAAQENYRELLASPTEEDIALAKAQLEQARLNWEKAKTSLWATQADRDAIKGRPSSPQYQIDSADAKVSAAELAVQAAEVDYGQAQINYALQTQKPTAGELASALAQINNAQDAVHSLRESPTAAELASAESQVAQAQAQLAELEASPTAEDLAAAEAQVEHERLNLLQAELDLEAPREALEDTVLLASMDGTVMEVSAKVGQVVGTTPFIALADLSRPLIEIYLDETDLDNIAVGNEVEVVLDALPDEEFKGRVVQVDPSLATVEGVETITALVELDERTLGKLHALPMGLNASVDVMGARAEGALLVPVEALRELGPGEYAVFVVEDGEPKLRVVEVGLMDVTYAEILSGLEMGDVVTTGVVEVE